MLYQLSYNPEECIYNVVLIKKVLSSRYFNFSTCLIHCHHLRLSTVPDGCAGCHVLDMTHTFPCSYRRRENPRQHSYLRKVTAPSCALRGCRVLPEEDALEDCSLIISKHKLVKKLSVHMSISHLIYMTNILRKNDTFYLVTYSFYLLINDYLLGSNSCLMNYC